MRPACTTIITFIHDQNSRNLSLLIPKGFEVFQWEGFRPWEHTQIQFFCYLNHHYSSLFIFIPSRNSWVINNLTRFHLAWCLFISQAVLSQVDKSPKKWSKSLNTGNKRYLNCMVDFLLWPPAASSNINLKLIINRIILIWFDNKWIRKIKFLKKHYIVFKQQHVQSVATSMLVIVYVDDKFDSWIADLRC